MSRLSIFKKRVEEVRVASLKPEELRAEQLQLAESRVEEAHYQLEQLKKEWAEMDAKHQLSMNGFTLMIGKYSPGEPDVVLAWWRDWTNRSHAAQVEFNESLRVWAGLKGAN